MATFNGTSSGAVSRPDDDGWEAYAVGGAPGVWSSTAMRAGVDSGNAAEAAYRFRHEVPASAVLTSATLLLEVDSIIGAPSLDVRFQLSQGDAAPVGPSNLPSAMSKTVAAASWAPAGPGPGIIDVLAPLQELFAASAGLWESGQRCVVVVEDDGSQAGQVLLNGYEVNAGASRLVVGYTVPLLTIARVPGDAVQWARRVTTPRLVDGRRYLFEVVALDEAGNESEATQDGPVGGADGRVDYVVRTPDAPAFSVNYDSGTQTVEFVSA